MTGPRWIGFILLRRGLQLFTFKRVTTLVVGLLAIGTWRVWRRRDKSVSREVALLQRLAKPQRRP